MDNLTKEQRKIIMNSLGEVIIKKVRDLPLKVSMDIAEGKTRNLIKVKQYEVLQTLTPGQQEAVCDLLSETITDTIYNFLEMFEEHSEEIKMLIKYGENEYDITQISEKMGSEIACYEEDGWIQKFSAIGRFVL